MKIVFFLFLLYFIPTCVFPQNGALDHSFGIGGIITTDIGDLTDQANTVLICSNDDILVAGISGNSAGIVKYHRNGGYDTDFGNNGIVIYPADCSLAGQSAALQPDGKILLGGVVTNADDDISITRFLSEGSPDNSFGNNGSILIELTGTDELMNGIIIQPDGKIIIAGTSTTYLPDDNENRILLIRLLANGTFDASFGINGIGTYSIGATVSDFAHSLVLQNDGKIIVAGNTHKHGLDFSDFLLLRCNTDGSIDSSFGTGGTVIKNVDGLTNASASALVQPDGKILLAGYENNFWEALTYFSILRFFADGTTDIDFAENGLQTTVLSNNGYDYAMYLQPDDKILLIGTNFDDSLGNNFDVLRYLPDGSPDNTFGNSGLVRTKTGDMGSVGTALAMQSDGKIIAAGFALNETTETGGQNQDFSVVRYFSGLEEQPTDYTDPDIMVYPDPVSSYAVVAFQLSAGENVSMDLLNLNHVVVQKIVTDEYFFAGYNTKKIYINKDLPAGIYFLRIRTGITQLIAKIVKS